MGSLSPVEGDKGSWRKRGDKADDPRMLLPPFETEGLIGWKRAANELLKRSENKKEK